MNQENILSVIIASVREILPELAEHAIQRSDRLVDLGANSVDRAEIIAIVMEQLSLSVPRVELATAKNIGELADLIYAKKQSA